VYVTNVPPDAAPERLRGFFARFGELESGPFGFDAGTGRSLGYALFVYGAAAGAATAVAEPYRVFEGRTLHCQLANEPARKAKAQSAAADLPSLQPVLDAIAAAGVGNLASYVWDPARAAASLGQNPALAAAVLSSALAAAAQSPAVAAAVATSPAAASAPMPVGVAAGRPTTTAATVVPSPVKFGVGPSSGGTGLLGPYKPPSVAATAAPASDTSTPEASSI
jgi:heterogeneous nuclear ribonucleoprotein A1/A3